MPFSQSLFVAVLLIASVFTVLFCLYAAVKLFSLLLARIAKDTVVSR